MTASAWAERRDQKRVVRNRASIVETLATDLRVTVRGLARAPLFAAVVILAISVGVGGVATIFSALNAIVLRPLPGTTGGDRLVGIDRRTPDFSEGVSASVSFYRYLRDSASTLEGVAVWSRVPLSIVIGDEAIDVAGSIVSGNYFDVLGVRPVAGRFFEPDEDRAGTAPVVVLSHAFWQARLNGASNIIGHSLRLNGRLYRVVGVAPPAFRGVFTPLKIDAWVPLGAQHHVHPSRDDPDAPWLWMFGRLRDGVGSGQARSELAARTASWVNAHGDDYLQYSSVRLTPLTGLPDDARRALLGFGAVLLGAAALVLLIASANVSSLLAVRAVARRREMAIRTALGAGRWRLVRQLLVETLGLFAAGAIGGTLIAAAGTSALERLRIPSDSGLSLELSPDLRVLAFSFAVALAAGVVFGLGPALKGASRNPAAALRTGAPGAGRRTVFSSVLIVAQFACSVVLLASAALFLRALVAGAAMDPGFDTRHVVVSTFNTQAYGYDDEKGQRFYAALERELERQPGIERVATANSIPLTISMSGTVVSVGRKNTSERVRVQAESALVSPEYFRALEIPIVAGRSFSASDTAGSADVAIVNETFARRAWADGAALGRTVDIHGRRVTIVGIARNAKYSTLTEGSVAFVYEATAQRWSSGQTLFVRTRMSAADTAAALRTAVASIDPALPRPVAVPLANETQLALLPQRVAAIVTSVLGITGLALAAIGLYGLISYGVTLRLREIGVRLALGARDVDIVRLTLGRGIRLAASGLALGIAAALLTTRVIAAYLVNVSAVDPVAFAGACVVLVTVALGAAYLPARRAASADPLVVLRAD